MIVLFTDFGTTDPYVGQMHGTIRRETGVGIVDLFHHVPNYDIRAGAFLLESLQRLFQPGDVFVCVVDPGVGGVRAPVMLCADDKWYVGPDNGLFTMIHRRAHSAESWRIGWRPSELSKSFHGRDLFGPVAARLAEGRRVESALHTLSLNTEWPDDLPEIILVDHYGNAMTGYRANRLSAGAVIAIKGIRLEYRSTFSEAVRNVPFWYRNSLGLVEIAMKEASATEKLELLIGDEINITDYEKLLE